MSAGENVPSDPRRGQPRAHGSRRVKLDWPKAFRGVRAALDAELPAAVRPFSWTAWSWMAKAWYGNKALHHEIWVRHSAKVVEIGLHFEADELTNARLLGAFRMRSREIARALGPSAKIEEWDKGWARVWEPFPLGEDDLVERIRSRFVDYVRVLEPILRDELPADVAWRLPAARGGRLSVSRASRSGRR